MSRQCDVDRTQFRLDFSEGGHAVKLIDIDTSTVGQTVTDIQRLFGELEAIFSERDTTRIAFQFDSGGGGELAACLLLTEVVTYRLACYLRLPLLRDHPYL